MLCERDVSFYREHGWLRIRSVYTPREVRALAEHLDRCIETWAVRNPGWSGDWRRRLMDAELDARSQLVSMHDLQLYSETWLRAVSKPKLVRCLELLDGPVELHHTTMHVKPPEAGVPFPMHQDFAFYPHTDDRYVDVLLHLDDTTDANGELRFLDGSHHAGPRDHIARTAAGEACEPYLDPDVYRLHEAVPVPARAGDVVCFNINTVHGSRINSTAKPRRLVRMGYRHPDNAQTAGQSHGRPGLLVGGFRPRPAGA
jgi:ectoine hydroxylase-related dioxygenase (phytanoyl-CoA dioxygenase family)